MPQKIWRDALFLIIGFAALWAVFAYFSKPVSLPDEYIPQDKKEKIADWIEEQVSKSFGVVENHQWQEALNEIILRLNTSEKIKQSGYEIIILDNSNINAFATLGTKIYVFRGLMEQVEQHEEIAAVIAHEMAHVELNHVEQKLITEFGLAVLTGILTGGDLALSRQILKDITSGAFSRAKEREADDFALDLLHDRGINPSYMGIVFKKLKDSQANLPGVNIEILSTHPDISKRIKKAFEYEKENFEEKAFETIWP
jgi:predicted Zn-dependent protease